jgi:hypothetical protein
LLEFAKKKRKRTDSGSDVDLDVTPPRSPKDGDDGTPIEKRRSGRNTNKRKKYIDEIDLNLSDDDNILSSLPPDFAAEIKASGAAIPAVTSSSSTTSAGATNVVSSPVVSNVVNEDSVLNGGGDNTLDTTQTSEFNMDDNSKQQSESGADLHSGGPNYAYIVSSDFQIL